MIALPPLTLDAESVSASLDDLRAEGYGRWVIAAPDAEAYWRAHRQVEREAAEFAGLYPHLEDLRDQDVVLGFLGRSHLGDVLCTSPLVRRLATERNCRVYAVRHRAIFKTLESNPHLTGYRNEDRVSLSPHVLGPGHMVQKLTRAFGLSIDPFPKGELYLSDAELKWAWSVRGGWPRNRPVAIVSAGSRTDNSVVPSSTLQWQEWVDVLSRRFTVVQVAVTNIQCLEEVARLSDENRRTWRPDHILDNCYVMENLSVRQFFSLFAVADMFIGTNSGGMHIAAAMNVPALIALPKLKYPLLPTFPDRVDSGPWRHESFLYPQHTFLHQD
jgi:ADP-heptose:LPS heptosyltransferase